MKEVNLTKIEKVALWTIKNIHYKYRDILDIKELSDLFSSGVKELTPHEVERYTSLYPIPVMVRNSEYYCIGEIPMFLFAKKSLSKNNFIYVRKFEGKINKEFYELMHYEMVIKPIFHKIDNKNLNLLYKSHNHLEDKRRGSKKITSKLSKVGFSDWVDCDVRNIK